MTDLTANDLRDAADLLEQLEAREAIIDRSFLGGCVSKGSLRFMIENRQRHDFWQKIPPARRGPRLAPGPYSAQGR
jgi:hypothetical protein